MVWSVEVAASRLYLCGGRRGTLLALSIAQSGSASVNWWCSRRGYGCLSPFRNARWWQPASWGACFYHSRKVWDIMMPRKESFPASSLYLGSGWMSPSQMGWGSRQCQASREVAFGSLWSLMLTLLKALQGRVALGSLRMRTFWRCKSPWIGWPGRLRHHWILQSRLKVSRMCRLCVKSNFSVVTA